MGPGYSSEYMPGKTTDHYYSSVKLWSTLSGSTLDFHLCISCASQVYRGLFIKGEIFLDLFFFFIVAIQHFFICRPSNSTVSEDAGIEPKTVATFALDALTTRLHLIQYFVICFPNVKLRMTAGWALDFHLCTFSS
jgi:hypothetical protein